MQSTQKTVMRITTCDRHGHNWYFRKHGGVYCTRCSQPAGQGCVKAGKACDHIEHDGRVE